MVRLCFGRRLGTDKWKNSGWLGTRGLCNLPSSLLFLTVLSGPSALDETLKSSHELVSLLFGAVLLLLFFGGEGGGGLFLFCFVRGFVRFCFSVVGGSVFKVFWLLIVVVVVFVVVVVIVIFVVVLLKHSYTFSTYPSYLCRQEHLHISASVFTLTTSFSEVECSL